MFDITEFMDQFEQTKKRWKKISSNVMISANEVEVYAFAKESGYNIGTHLVCLYYIDGEYVHLSYALDDESAYVDFKKYINRKEFKNRTKIVDLIGKSNTVAQYAQNLEKVGFMNDGLYRKWEWRRSQNKIPLQYEDIKEQYHNICITYAEISDLDTIAILLSKAFQGNISRIPTRDKMLFMIDKKQILCAKKEESIVGIYIIEIISPTICYLHMLASAPEYKGTGIGVLLLSYVLEKFGQIECFWLWVERNNRDSNRIIRYFGFNPNEKLSYFVMKKG